MYFPLVVLFCFNTVELKEDVFAMFQWYSRSALTDSYLVLGTILLLKSVVPVETMSIFRIE